MDAQLGTNEQPVLKSSVAKGPWHALQSRVKQLHCLYGMSRLIEEQFASGNDGTVQQTAILQGVVDSIPAACEHPEVTCARVVLDGCEYRTVNFHDTAVRVTRTLHVLGEARGILEVAYLGGGPSAEPSGFSAEERDLFRAIGERLGKIVQLLHAEMAMKRAHEELELRVQQRTAELAAANEELRKEVQQRRWTEDRLRESEQKLRAVFDQTFQLIGVLTPDGTLIEANRTALAFTGAKDRDVLGKPLWEAPGWTHSAEMQKRLRAALKAAAAGEFARFEAIHPKADGSMAYVDFSVKPVADDGGRVVFLVAEGRDITARKQAEEALRNSMRLQIEAEKVVATGRLAAQVAHEINNPLAGIKNAFRLVKHAVPEQHPHHRYVGRIEKEINHIADIVRQVFEVHRGNQETIHDVSVVRTIEEVVGMLEPARRQHEVAIRFGGEDPLVVAPLPEGALRQILYNLLANAIEASPGGGNVKIQVRRSEDSFGVSVSDEGEGIPEELRSRVFEPFFSTKSNLGQPGLGLGLFISRRTAERLGGSLDFHSEPGKGCVFELVLPIRLGKGTTL